MSNLEVSKSGKENETEPDNLDEYRLPGLGSKSKPAQEKRDDKPTKPIEPKDKAAPRDESAKTHGRFIDETTPVDEEFRLGMLGSEQLPKLAAICKRMEETLTRQILEVKQYINSHGKDPVTVLANGANDSTKVNFWGEFHGEGKTNPDYELFLKALEQVHPIEVLTPADKTTANAIMTPELPDAFQPLFDRYNNSPLDTKFTVPEGKDLDQLLGEKAAKFFRHNESLYSQAFKLYETAHKKGIQIIAIDDPAVMDVLDAKDIDKAALEVVQGGSKNPDRENYMKKKLLSIIKEHPNSPIIVAGPCGAGHARENNNADYNPVSELLAKDPDFIKTKKEVSSFSAFSVDTAALSHRLSAITDGLIRPVWVSARGKDIPDLLSTGNIIPEIDDRNMSRYKDFDGLIFASQEQSSHLPVPSKTVTGVAARPESFLKTGGTEKERQKLGDRINIQQSEMKEITELFAAGFISDNALAKLKHSINEVGQPPGKQMGEIFNKPRSSVFVMDVNRHNPRINNNREATKARILLADALSSSPKGSCLMVDMPLIFKPVIDRFNESPKGTNLDDFLKADQGFQELIRNNNNKNLFGHYAENWISLTKVYESAHDNNVQIIPFGTNKYDLGEAAIAERHARIESYSQRIYEETAQRPNASVIVWNTRGRVYNPQVEQTLMSNPQFQSLNRNVDRIGFVGPVHSAKTLAPLCKDLKEPVWLDLRDPRLSDLSSRANMDISLHLQPSLSYSTFLHYQRTYRELYEHLIMLPDSSK